MKKFSFLMLFFAFAILSCTTDDAFTDGFNNEKTEVQTYTLKKATAFVATNKNNPFDNAGVAYEAILEAYRNENYTANNAEDIIAKTESIANSLPEFNALKTSNHYITADYEVLKEIIEGRYSFENALTDSGLTPNAKTVLSNFLNHLENQEENSSPENLHAFIVNFESTLLQETDLSGYDLEIIFNTTSILRYVNGEKSTSNSDPIWIRNKTSITATLYGMSQSTAQGVLNAVVVTLLENTNN